MTLKHPTLEQDLAALEVWCKDQEYDLLVADAAQTALLQLQAAVKRLSWVRKAAVRRLAEAGHTHREIANELSLSHGRIDQILK